VRALSVTILCIFLCGCAQSSVSDYLPQIDAPPPAATTPAAVYSFGVLPLHNAVRLFESYQPLIDEINSRVSGFTLRLETAKDYPHYETKVRERRLNFVMMYSHLVIPSEERGYRIIGRTGDKIRGLILVRNDSGIHHAKDLKASSVSFASRTDLPGAMMPKLLLKQNGLDMDQQITGKYVGSPDSALMNVVMKLSAAGCVSESAWLSFRTRRPDIASLLEVRWATPPLVGPGILARKDIPQEHVQSVARVLFGLEQSESGRKVLTSMGVSSFQPANAATYDTVWEFLNEYRKAFGHTLNLGGAE
jgi:ABC-type phosphate/phosphonate transport system substrate-binding protein